MTNRQLRTITLGLNNYNIKSNTHLHFLEIHTIQYWNFQTYVKLFVRSCFSKQREISKNWVYAIAFEFWKFSFSLLFNLFCRIRYVIILFILYIAVNTSIIQVKHQFNFSYAYKMSGNNIVTKYAKE